MQYKIRTLIIILIFEFAVPILEFIKVVICEEWISINISNDLMLMKELYAENFSIVIL